MSKNKEAVINLMADLEIGACVNHGCPFYDSKVKQNCLVHCRKPYLFDVSECPNGEEI